MSTTAFAELERAETLRDQQSEVSRDERARNIDNIVSEQLRREDEFDALRIQRAMNGPTPLELAQQRITDLEQQRDDIAREIVEWVQDLQAYFPGASTMHDIYKGIEALEMKAAVLRGALTYARACIEVGTVPAMSTINEALKS